MTWYIATVNKQTVQLLDMPGFNDQHYSNSELLRSLSTELALVHTGNRSLHGFIYVQDISSPRLGGQASKVTIRMLPHGLQ